MPFESDQFLESLFQSPVEPQPDGAPEPISSTGQPALIAGPYLGDFEWDDPPETEQEPEEWPEDAVRLIAWFKSAEATLPRQPFDLCLGVKVTDPAKFYAGLNRNIEAGPVSARRRGLLHDLAALKTVAE